jgi:hypothetical protein
VERSMRMSRCRPWCSSSTDEGAAASPWWPDELRRLARARTRRRRPASRAAARLRTRVAGASPRASRASAARSGPARGARTRSPSRRGAGCSRRRCSQPSASLSASVPYSASYSEPQRALAAFSA